MIKHANNIRKSDDAGREALVVAHPDAMDAALDYEAHHVAEARLLSNRNGFNNPKLPIKKLFQRIL